MISKAKYKISNWKQYNQALINRGLVTFWGDEAAIQSWHSKEHHGKRGRGFTDGAIETALMIKGIFKLPLRALQGFLDSIFVLMDVPLKSPSYRCISKRAKTVEVQYRLPITHVVIDATGLKVFGDGEWKRETDYHQRSLSETGMYWYKKLLSPQLALRDYDAQVGEALANVKAMNKVIRLGMPVSYLVE